MTATRLTAGVIGAFTALVLALTAAPAGAQPALVQGGLVNVGVTTGDITLEEVIVLQDLIDVGDVTLQDLVTIGNVDVVVQVPIGIAANVCPAVNAAVLGQANQGGGISCVADAESAADSRAFQRFTQTR